MCVQASVTKPNDNGSGKTHFNALCVCVCRSYAPNYPSFLKVHFKCRRSHLSSKLLFKMEMNVFLRFLKSHMFLYMYSYVYVYTYITHVTLSYILQHILFTYIYALFYYTCIHISVLHSLLHDGLPVKWAEHCI